MLTVYIIMEDVIFINTDGWWALIDKSDKYHNEAVKIWTSFKENALLPITSNVILYNILIDKINIKFSHNAACEFIKTINKSKVLKIYHIDEEIIEDALRLFLNQTHTPTNLCFIDFMTISLMHKLKINCIFTFNKTFAEFDFIILLP